MNTPNLHIFKTTYLIATDTKGARIKITSLRFDQSVILNREYDKESTAQALDHLREQGFNILGKSSVGNNDYIVSDTFEPLK